jgi:hypothetical protein
VERLAGRGGPDAEAALAAARAEAQAAAARPGPMEQQAPHDAAARQTMGDLLAGERPAATLPPPVAPPADAMRLAGLPEPELRAHVRAVVDELLAARGGLRADGAWRPDLGAITIEWGNLGTGRAPDYAGGQGLAQIIARRDAEGLDGQAFVRDVLPEVLTQGRITRVYGPEQGRRVDLEWNGNRVVLSLFRSGQRENWVLSGFPLDGGPGGTRGVNPAPPYAPAPSGIRATAGAGPPGSTLPEGPRRFNTYTPTGRAVLVEPRVVSLRTLVPIPARAPAAEQRGRRRRAGDGMDGDAWIRDVLPDVLLRGAPSAVYGLQRNRPTINLDWQGHRVVLRLDRDGQR